MPDYYSDFRFGSFGQERASFEGNSNSAEPLAIEGLAGGGYVLAFAISSDVFIRVYDENGEATGDAIQVATGLLLDFDLVATADGGFAAVYPTTLSDATGLTYLITAQFFDATGTALDDPFNVIESDRGLQQAEAVLLENGDLVVAWTAQSRPDSVQAQVLSPAGEPRGDVFTLSQTGAVNGYFYPQLDALAGGGFVASWSANNEVYARTFDDAGQPVGAIVSPQPDQEFIQNHTPSVVALPDGNFMLVWSENLFEFEPSRVMAAIYDADGNEVVAAFRVDSSNVYETIQPNIELLDDGSVLIAWSYRVPGNGPNFFQIGEIRAQRVSADGQLLGEEFQVDDGSDAGQHLPMIASFGTGDVAVVWNNFTENPITDNVQLRNFYSVTSGDDGSNIMDGTAGVDFLRGLDGVDFLTGGLGDDSLDGGSNVDRAIVSGNRADYTVTQIATGVFEVVGQDGTDLLTAVEFLQFDDDVLRLLPGSGVSVNFDTADPSVYQDAMDAIRDFDGNALGGDSAWLRIGSADINGDGDVDQILVNDAIGRFATVGTAPDGLTYFEDYSWAGETRVAGIYIDPLVQSGDVVAGSDNDSQRRFQNDLQIENINRVLGADDYDGDGVWEVYLALTDGTAYLRALMHEDGNIRYANYQSEQEVIDYLTANGYDENTFGDWFSAATSTADTLTFVNEGPKIAEIEALARPTEMHSRPSDGWAVDGWAPESFG